MTNLQDYEVKFLVNSKHTKILEKVEALLSLFGKLLIICSRLIFVDVVAMSEIDNLGFTCSLGTQREGSKEEKEEEKKEKTASSRSNERGKLYFYCADKVSSFTTHSFSFILCLSVVHISLSRYKPSWMQN